MGQLEATRWLREASFDASSVASSEVENRRKLIEGVVFSRWFIVTYQGAICGIVLLFTIWHWYGKLVRHRPRRQNNNRTDLSISSSSSSTVQGNVTPSESSKVAHEETPLLEVDSSESTPGHPRSVARAVRAIGMYQPRPIPLVNKALPSNATTVLVLLLLGLNIFYVTYNITFKLGLAFVFSDRTSLLFVANLPWLYLLAAKNQPIKLLTGYSYENLNIIHRRLGELLCLLALVHGAGMIVVWYDLFSPNGVSIWTFLSHRVILLGLAAFVSYELLFFTSLASFRAWWYEVFLGSHIFLQAAGLVLVFFHHPGGRVYTAITLAIFLIDRLVFRLAIKTRSLRADLTLTADGDTVLVSANWPLPSPLRKLPTTIFGSNIRWDWEPTEHVFLTVPAMAKKHLVQAHPFTIASAAPEGDGEESKHAWFNLIIRAHDGFSRDLVNYARDHTSAQVRLDGPYGSMHALEMLRSSDIALIVVGGSGIAVAFPLIWTLLHAAADTETARPKRNVGLIWVVHEASHISWIGHERLDELKEKGLQLCIPTPTSKAGRPDMVRLVHEVIDDMIGRTDVHDDPRIGVVVSGPDSMNRAVRNECASMAWRGVDIDVAVEKYGW